MLGGADLGMFGIEPFAYYSTVRESETPVASLLQLSDHVPMMSQSVGDRKKVKHPEPTVTCRNAPKNSE